MNPKAIAILLTLVLCLLSGPILSAAEPQKSIDFNRDVRPILANHCWNCHGQDEAARKASLRLDQRSHAIARTKSDDYAIVPGRPDQSALIDRIHASPDDDGLMPPNSFQKPLSPAQKETLRLWISSGANYAEHWAFTPPQRSNLPEIKNKPWPRQPIDFFVLQKLEESGLTPSPEADRATWLRRVSLDLTGLPPTPAQRQAFLLDQSTHAHEKVVDQLLASPHHAERLAMQWLDLARYADTNGYNNDEVRTLWPWRDWVIQAFASNMPYDRFITEQIAGDLIPNATIAQKVATGFNRNHVLTTEGGIIEEEYHVEYVADRVHTTSTVFMGLSMQCARCHDHKYDPFSQRDYYQFAGFFNNVPDKIVSYSKGRMADPLLEVPSPSQKLEQKRLFDQIQKTESLVASRPSTVEPDLQAWELGLNLAQLRNSPLFNTLHHFPLDDSNSAHISDLARPETAAKLTGKFDSANGRIGKALNFDGSTHIEAPQVADFEANQSFSISAWVYPTSLSASTIASRMDETQAYRGFDLILENGHLATHFANAWPNSGFKLITKNPLSLNAWHHVLLTSNGSRNASGINLYVDGALQQTNAPTNNPIVGSIRTSSPFRIGLRSTSAPFRGRIDDLRIFNVSLPASSAHELAKGQPITDFLSILSLQPNQRSDSQKSALRNYFIEQLDPQSSAWRIQLANLKQSRDDLQKNIPVTMIMQEISPPRKIHILRRGQYDQPADEVSPAVFKSFANIPAQPPNRLGLARWLTHPNHPLTARVAVNRYWEMLFGTGLVETVEDFGIQGSLPSHPSLLDTLAVDFISGGWDLRKLLKQIVLSATYRQSSSATPKQLELDPKNRLLGRGPRFRLPAETVRDNALAISGLLARQVGGPSVKPYQPDGLWEDVSVERREKYTPDPGDSIYRRSMYTFWKRTCPPPGMAMFDAPDRETCLARRARTNTPLQSLVLLNDPTYVEAARKFAERIMASSPDTSTRLENAFLIALCRTPKKKESAILRQILSEASSQFSQNPASADQFLSVGRSPRSPLFSPADLAAWSTVTSLILNLDETISKP